MSEAHDVEMIDVEDTDTNESTLGENNIDTPQMRNNFWALSDCYFFTFLYCSTLSYSSPIFSIAIVVALNLFDLFLYRFCTYWFKPFFPFCYSSLLLLKVTAKSKKN